VENRCCGDFDPARDPPQRCERWPKRRAHYDRWRARRGRRRTKIPNCQRATGRERWCRRGPSPQRSRPGGVKVLTWPPAG
jgi:hypothetical protein